MSGAADSDMHWIWSVDLVPMLVSELLTILVVLRDYHFVYIRLLSVFEMENVVEMSLKVCLSLLFLDSAIFGEHSVVVNLLDTGLRRQRLLHELGNHYCL